MDVTSRKRQFVINAASGWVAQATFAAVGFALMPYAIWRLGQESYGVFLLARSAIAFFMLMQLGMGQSLIRFCSQALVRKDMDKIASISSTAQFIMASLGLTATCICLAIIPFFINFYNIPSTLIWDTKVMLFCMATSLLLSMFGIVLQSLLYSASRYDMANGIEIASHLFRLVLVIAFFELIHPSIALFGLSFLIVSLFRLITLYSMAVKAIGRTILFSPRYVSFSKNRDILKFSFLPLVNTIAMVTVFQSPILIIGKVLGEETVTLFAPAVLISQVLNSFLGQTSRPLTPLASYDKEHNNGKNLGKWAIQFGQVTAILGFSFTLIFCLFGSEILRYWLGPNFSCMWGIVTLMTASVTMMQIQVSTNSMALGASNFRPVVFSNVVMAVTMVVGTLLCLILGGNLLAVALLFFSCSAIRNIIFLPWCYAKDFRYNMGTYVGLIYIKTLVFLSVIIGVGYILRMISPDTISSEIISFFGVAAALFIAAWILLPEEIKRDIKKIIVPTIQGSRI